MLEQNKLSNQAISFKISRENAMELISDSDTLGYSNEELLRFIPNGIPRHGTIKITYFENKLHLAYIKKFEDTHFAYLLIVSDTESNEILKHYLANFEPEKSDYFAEILTNNDYFCSFLGLRYLFIQLVRKKKIVFVGSKLAFMLFLTTFIHSIDKTLLDGFEASIFSESLFNIENVNGVSRIENYKNEIGNIHEGLVIVNLRRKEIFASYHSNLFREAENCFQRKDISQGNLEIAKVIHNTPFPVERMEI